MLQCETMHLSLLVFHLYLGLMQWLKSGPADNEMEQDVIHARAQ